MFAIDTDTGGGWSETEVNELAASPRSLPSTDGPRREHLVGRLAVAEGELLHELLAVDGVATARA